MTQYNKDVSSYSLTFIRNILDKAPRLYIGLSDQCKLFAVTVDSFFPDDVAVTTGVGSSLKSEALIYC